MQPEVDLSPVTMLSLMRLTSTSWHGTWPGLLLHSRNPGWPFDDQGRPADLAARAATSGLHPVTDPFTAKVEDAPGWSFRLPTLRRTAQLASPTRILTINRRPHVTDEWWQAAVTHGSRCRLLVAVCVFFDGDPADNVNVLAAAAAGNRVYGATITVEF